jgi:type II secretory pathway component GspD/PulD (secretin)
MATHGVSTGPEAVRTAEKFVASVDVPEPEVLIEVEVLEIARSKPSNLGITYPGARNKEKAKILTGSRVPVITSSTDAICYCDWGFVYVPRNIRRSMKSVIPAAD